MIPLARTGEPRWRAGLLLLPRLLGAAVTFLLLGLIRGYQLLLSPRLGPTCRFHPSCSAYAAGSLRTHGALKGTGLAVWRLLRCNPWNLGGLDPVPAKGRWRPDIHPDGRPRTLADGAAATAAGGAATTGPREPKAGPVRPVPSMRAEI